MKTKITIPLGIFFLAFLIHFAYFILSKTYFSPWVTSLLQTNLWINNYFEQKEYLLSYSYALSLAFVLFLFLESRERRKKEYKETVFGLSFTAILYGVGCFLIGCCGSPLAVVYLGLLGSSFLGFTKLFVAILTTASVVIGFIWFRRKLDCQTCEDNCKRGKI